MVTLTLFHFKSPISSMKYYLKNGKACDFINHKFVTDEIAVAEELRTVERETGIVEKSPEQLEAEDTSPMEILKARIREEERAKLLAEFRARAEQVRAGNQDMGTGTNTPGRGTVTSATVGEAMAESLGDAGAVVSVVKSATAPKVTINPNVKV